MTLLFLFISVFVGIVFGATIHADKKSYHGFHELSNLEGFYHHEDICHEKGHHHIREYHHQGPKGEFVKLKYNISFHPQYHHAFIHGNVTAMNCRTIEGEQNQSLVLVRFDDIDAAEEFLKEVSVANVVSSYPPYLCQDSNSVSIHLMESGLLGDNKTVYLGGLAMGPLDTVRHMKVDFETNMLDGKFLPFAHPNKSSEGMTTTPTTSNTSSHEFSELADPVPDMNSVLKKFADNPFGADTVGIDPRMSENAKDTFNAAETVANKKPTWGLPSLPARPSDTNIKIPDGLGSLSRHASVSSKSKKLRRRNMSAQIWPGWFAPYNLNFKYVWKPIFPTEFQKSLAEIEKDINKASWARDALEKAMQSGIWEWQVVFVGDAASKDVPDIKAPGQSKATDDVKSYFKRFTRWLFGSSVAEDLGFKLDFSALVKVQPRIQFSIDYDGGDDGTKANALNSFQLYLQFYYQVRFNLGLELKATKKLGDKPITLLEMMPVCLPIPLGVVSISLCPKTEFKLQWNFNVEASLKKKYTYAVHGYKLYGWKDGTAPAASRSSTENPSTDSYFTSVPLGYDTYLGKKCTLGYLTPVTTLKKSASDCAETCTKNKDCKGIAYQIGTTAPNCWTSSKGSDVCGVTGYGLQTVVVAQGTLKTVVGGGDGVMYSLDMGNLQTTPKTLTGWAQPASGLTPATLKDWNVITASAIFPDGRYVLIGGTKPELKIIDTNPATPTVKVEIKANQFTVCSTSSSFEGPITGIQITEYFIHVTAGPCLCTFAHYTITTTTSVVDRVTSSTQFTCLTPFPTEPTDPATAKPASITGFSAIDRFVFLASEKKNYWYRWSITTSPEGNNKYGSSSIRLFSTEYPLVSVAITISSNFIGNIKYGYMVGGDSVNQVWVYRFVSEVNLPSTMYQIEDHTPVHVGRIPSLETGAPKVTALALFAGTRQLDNESPHVLYITTGNDAGQVNLWTIIISLNQSPLLIKQYNVHAGAVTGIAFSGVTHTIPNGHSSVYFISVSLDGKVVSRVLNDKSTAASRVTKVMWPTSTINSPFDCFTAFGYIPSTGTAPPKLVVPYSSSIGVVTLRDVAMHSAAQSVDCSSTEGASVCTLTPAGVTTTDEEKAFQRCSAVSANGEVSVVVRVLNTGTSSSSYSYITAVHTTTGRKIRKAIEITHCGAIGISVIKTGGTDTAYIAIAVPPDDQQQGGRVYFVKILFEVTVQYTELQNFVSKRTNFDVRCISFSDPVVEGAVPVVKFIMATSMGHFWSASSRTDVWQLRWEPVDIQDADVGDSVQSSIISCSFSKDGRFAAAALATSIQWFDFTSSLGTQLNCEQGRCDGVKYIAFSPDGGTLAIASSKIVSLINVQVIQSLSVNPVAMRLTSLSPYQRYEVPATEFINYVTFSSDGKYVAVSTSDKEIKNVKSNDVYKQSMTVTGGRVNFNIREWNVQDLTELVLTKPRDAAARFADIMNSGDSGNVMFFDKKGKNPEDFEYRPPWDKAYSTTAVSLQASVTLIFQQSLLIGLADPTGNLLSINFGGPYMSLSFGLLTEGDINKPFDSKLPAAKRPGSPTAESDPKWGENRDVAEREVVTSTTLGSFLTMVISLSAKVQFDIGIALIITFRVGWFGSFTVYDSTAKANDDKKKPALWTWGGPVQGLIIRYQFLISNPLAGTELLVCPVNARYGTFDKVTFPTFVSSIGGKSWDASPYNLYWPATAQGAKCAGLTGDPAKLCNGCGPLRWKDWSRPANARRTYHQLALGGGGAMRAPASSDVYKGVCDAESFKYMFQVRFREFDRIEFSISISLGNVVGQIGERSCQLKAYYRVKGEWTGIIDFVRTPSPSLDVDGCWMQPIPQVLRAKASDAGDHLGLWIYMNSMMCADVHLRYGLESILEDGDSLLSEQTMQSDPPMSQLIIHSDGNMVLYGYESDAVIWESGTAQSGTKTVESALKLDNGAVVLENTVNGVITRKVLNPGGLAGGKYLVLRNCDLQLFPDSKMETSLWNLTNQPCPVSAEVRSSPRWHRGGSYLYLGESLMQNSGLMNSNGFLQHERGVVHFVRMTTLEKAWSLTDESIRNIRTSAFTLQWDGNLVLHDYAGNIVWQSGTGGLGAKVLRLERCGIALYKQAPNIDRVWSFGLDVQCPDVADAAAFFWPPYTSSYPTAPNRMYPGDSLVPGQAILSRYGMLYHQVDGNVVVYSRINSSIPTPLWSTKTSGKCTNALTFQYNGALILYGCNGEVLWDAGISKSKPKMIEFTDTCKLSSYDAPVHSYVMAHTVLSIVITNAQCNPTDSITELIDHGECWWVQAGFYLSRSQFVATLTLSLILSLEPNGDLIFYATNPTRILWRSGTAGTCVSRFDFVNGVPTLIGCNQERVWDLSNVTTIPSNSEYLTLTETSMELLDINQDVLWNSIPIQSITIGVGSKASSSSNQPSQQDSGTVSVNILIMTNVAIFVFMVILCGAMLACMYFKMRKPKKPVDEKIDLSRFKMRSDELSPTELQSIHTQQDHQPAQNNPIQSQW